MKEIFSIGNWLHQPKIQSVVKVFVKTSDCGHGVHTKPDLEVKRPQG